MSVTVAAYRLACSWVRLHQTFISCFSGRSEMIVLSVFSRRSTNGSVIRRSSCAASAEPCRSTGTAYRSRNAFADPSRPGLANSMIDHSSESWFSTGVPVSAIRDAAGSALTAFACWLRWFLIAWASSHTTRAQPHLPTAPRRSLAAVWYVVITRSAAASAAASSAPVSRSAPWWTCTARSGVNRSASRCQFPVSDIGQISRVARGWEACGGRRAGKSRSS